MAPNEGCRIESTRRQLQQAAEQQVIEPGQVGPLFDFLFSRNKDQPRFDFTHVLYYLGGLVAIGAMSLFMTLGWERFGGWGIFFICLAYAGVGLKLAGHFERLIYLGILWQRNEQAVGVRLRARLPMELRHLLAERG